MLNTKNGIRVYPPTTEADERWLRDLWISEWGGENMVSRGKTVHVSNTASLIAWNDDTRVGAATYHVGNQSDCELLSINATVEGIGVGTALLTSFEEAVRDSGVSRVWLITSNDNIDALRFYQRRGYRITAVYPNAIDEARKLKPSIPLIGYYEIPIHDEVELEKWL